LDLKARLGVLPTAPFGMIAAMDPRGMQMIKITETGKTRIATADDPRWARVVARDRKADGQF
jgi:hypothetical protein